MSFAAMKENRLNDISKLTEAASAAGGGGDQKSYKDDRFWKPTVDKAGNGYAVVRFLPAPEGEDLPWVRYWDHGFKGPSGLWYIERSLTSLSQPDPVSEMNSKLWNTGRDEDKQTVRDRKRRLHYVTNIMVISDPSNPAAEGKVFLYQFGKKIFDKIMDLMQPQFQDEKPVNPFDFWEGADFKLKIRQVEGYRNYDKSEFAAPAALLNGDDTQLEGVYNRMHSLGEFLDPKSYKSYGELQEKLMRVLGESAPMTTAEAVSLDNVATSPSIPASNEPEIKSEGDKDDTLSYFAQLAKESA